MKNSSICITTRSLSHFHVTSVQRTYANSPVFSKKNILFTCFTHKKLARSWEDSSMGVSGQILLGELILKNRRLWLLFEAFWSSLWKLVWVLLTRSSVKKLNIFLRCFHPLKTGTHRIQHPPQSSSSSSSFFYSSHLTFSPLSISFHLLLRLSVERWPFVLLSCRIVMLFESLKWTCVPPNQSETREMRERLWLMGIELKVKRRLKVKKKERRDEKRSQDEEENHPVAWRAGERTWVWYKVINYSPAGFPQGH